MKEYIPDAHLQKYIHRFWIVDSPTAMPAEPAGFYRLFKIPIHLLNNDVVPLEVFPGARTREFKERVLEALRPVAFLLSTLETEP